jgi:hypothetical protein
LRQSTKTKLSLVDLQTVSDLLPAPLSPARQSLADAMEALEELQSRQTDAAQRCAAAQQAATDLVTAENIWRAFLFEDEQAAEADPSRKAILKHDVLDARERSASLPDEQAAVERLRRQADAAIFSVTSQVHAAVLEEVGIFAQRCHRHEVLALKHRAVVERLATKIMAASAAAEDFQVSSPGVQRNNGRRDVLAQLSIGITAALSYGPTPQAEGSAKEAMKASIAAYADEAAGFFEAIHTDPSALITDPEA